MVERWFILFLSVWGSLLWGRLAAQSGLPLPQDAGLTIWLRNLQEGQAPFVSHNLLFFYLQRPGSDSGRRYCF